MYRDRIVAAADLMGTAFTPLDVDDLGIVLRIAYM